VALRPRDYTKIPIAVPENTSNLSSFFYSDGWLKHVEGHTAEALFELDANTKATKAMVMLFTRFPSAT